MKEKEKITRKKVKGGKINEEKKTSKKQRKKQMDRKGKEKEGKNRKKQGAFLVAMEMVVDHNEEMLVVDVRCCYLSLPICADAAILFLCNILLRSLLLFRAYFVGFFDYSFQYLSFINSIFTSKTTNTLKSILFRNERCRPSMYFHRYLGS